MLNQQVELIAEVIREGIAEGSFRPVDAEKTAFVLILSARSLFHQDRYPFDGLLPLFSELTTAGLMTSQSEGP